MDRYSVVKAQRIVNEEGKSTREKMPSKTTLLVMMLSYFLFFTSFAHALSWGEDNPEGMDPGESVTISINGDCPPYTWEVTGKGYSIGYLITQEESNTLDSDDDTCGSAEIAVKDECGGEVTGYARGGVGSWVMAVDEMCGELLNPPPHIYLGCFLCSEVVSGKYKYKNCWFGGSRYDERYQGPYCSKWPVTEDLTGQTCQDPGSPVNWIVRGLMHHQKWRWECPEIELELPEGFDNNDCKSILSE